MVWLTWHSGTGNVPSYIYLCPVLCHAFCNGKNFMSDMFVHVILAAVCADLGRDIFNDKGHSVAIKGDGCLSLFGIPVFADDALHFYSQKLSTEGNFTSRKRSHAQFFLVSVLHNLINFPGDPGSVICFPALLADIRRYIFDHDDFPGSMCQKLRLSIA